MVWKTVFAIVGLGLVAGMRTFSAPALLSTHLARRQPQPGLGPPLNALASRRAATLLSLLAMGELAGDKLPMTPARIEPPGLAGRALSGALVGATLAEAEGLPRATGALLGGLAALGGAFAAYHLRRRLGQRTRVPDPVLGGVEDAIAVGGGYALLEATTR